MRCLKVEIEFFSDHFLKIKKVRKGGDEGPFPTSCCQMIYNFQNVLTLSNRNSFNLTTHFLYTVTGFYALEITFHLFKDYPDINFQNSLR